VRVPLFDMAAELAAVRADVDAAIARVLDRGLFINGPEVAAFERALAEATGARRAVGTGSGTDALLAILMSLGVGPGDEVVTTPLTFFATAGGPARLGARVVFADVDDATLCLDARAAASACGDRTRAVIPVHLFGHAAPLPAVPCAIVEDAAHRIGAPLGGRAAALSFFPTKNLGAIGDAGRRCRRSRRARSRGTRTRAARAAARRPTRARSAAPRGTPRTRRRSSPDRATRSTRRSASGS
jgi:dTDP-4-amino-4,6-dideoxygalactose transaminase